MTGKRITDIPGLMYLWKVDNLYLSGQPSALSWEYIKELGIKKVINIRSEDEMNFSQQIEIIKSLDLDYEQFPILSEGVLSPDNCEKLSQLVEKEDIPHFVHCGSANRVAAWLITYLTKFRGVEFEQAVEVAQENGLSNPAFIIQAEKICKA